MPKNRLEAFSDGVIAIIITIMVLEMKVPHGTELAALRPLLPVFLSYILSFIYVAIYWNNHHHLLHAVKHIDGTALWANMHLLFWLSLVPVATAWMGENHFAPWPVALYGVVLLGAAVAFVVLTRVLIAHHEQDSLIVRAIGNDFKGRVSLACYVTAIAFTFLNRWISCALYVAVAILWLIPDRRIEKKITTEEGY